MALKLPKRPRLGWWAVLALCLVSGLVVEADLDRFENPDGEKHVPLFPPGQNDFSYSYLGARALLAGVNPYHNGRPEFTHPLFPPEAYNGYKQVYPPGNLLLHVPLALWKGADGEAAGRVWFHLSLLALALLALLAWVLARHILDQPLTPAWIPLFFLCLSLNTGVELGLERGQSDILIALLAWAAVAVFTRGHYAAAIFLSIGSASTKGYTGLLAVGLILLALDRRQWKQTFVGAGLAIAVFVLPVARFLREAAASATYRSDMFWGVWYNHGFSNAVYYFAPTWRSKGRLVLSSIAAGVTVAAWIQARRSRSTAGSSHDALWTVVFASSALGAMVGYASLSVSYNLILFLPGMLILVACQQRVRSALALPRAAEHALGAALLGSVFLLFSYRLNSEGPPIAGLGAPLSAFGLVLAFLILAAVSGRALSRSTEEPRRLRPGAVRSETKRPASSIPAAPADTA
jgi:hypothetical protein